MLQHLAQLIIPQLLALSDPCVVLVDEPRTVYRAVRGHEWRPYVSAHALNRRRAEVRALAYSRIDMADVRDSPSSEVGG